MLVIKYVMNGVECAVMADSTFFALKAGRKCM